jgi:hypothetical protein
MDAGTLEGDALLRETCQRCLLEAIDGHLQVFMTA